MAEDGREVTHLQLADYLRVDAVDAQLAASNKPGVIRALVGLLLRVGEGLDPNEVVDRLIERESLQSTGIGRGVAIPHARISGLNEPLIAVGLSPEGLDFEALDGQLTRLFITILVPEDSQAVHLKLLARVSRLIGDAERLSNMLNSLSTQSLYEAFVQGDASL